MANRFTYKTSEYINDPTFRSRWLDAVSQNRIKVVIDGVEIPSYSDYTYVDVKSYFKEPERSSKGVINNLNSYATFLTPKLRFSFNSMPISAYRTLMRLIKERNEFTVQVYDPVEDEVVVRKMYFSPKDYPQIYTKGYDALRITNEEFELIGTNADLNTYSLVYNSNVTSTSNIIRYAVTMTSMASDGDGVVIDGNSYTYGATQSASVFTGSTIIEQVTSLAEIATSTNYTISSNSNQLIFVPINTNNQTAPTITAVKSANGTIEFGSVTPITSGGTSNITTGLTFYYGQDITIGDYDSDVEGAIDPTTFTNAGFVLNNWNTASDGSGETFLTGQSGIQFTSNKTLYAMWKSQTEYTVSFDYQAGTDYSGQNTTSITVIQGNPYGMLPNQVNRNGYIFGGWYTQMNGQGTQITQDETGYSSVIFNKTYNETLYAYWIGASATVSFNANTGTGIIDSIPSYTGAEITLPVNTTQITKDGYQFMGWGSTAEATTIYAQDGGTLIVPAGGITLYAIWQQTYLLTYDHNDGTGTKTEVRVAVERTPIYLSRNGFDLIGWYDYTNNEFVTFPLEITENKTIYASWEAKQ